MKTSIQLAALALLLATLNAPLSTIPAQGVLTPPGAPAATMKTLAQIEPRTPISAVPFTISTAGSYYLTTNLTVNSGNAITLATNGVTLNLGGFTIASTAPSASGDGIHLNAGLRNLTILNGFIQGGVTNNGGTNTYAGPGFVSGISYSALPAPLNARVSGISVLGCKTFGINLNFGDATIVESCSVHTVGNDGITASIVNNSVATDCGDVAINADEVANCRGESTGGKGIWTVVVMNSVGYRPGGTAIQATVANGCYASSGTNVITYKYNMP